MVVLTMVLLQACDSENNFFYHPVTFNGEYEDAQLVVTSHLKAGEAPLVYVSRSWFFMDSTQRDTIPYIIVGADGDTIGSQYIGSNRGWLRDAKVEMQVDGGAWETLRGEEILLATNRYYNAYGGTQYEHAYGYRASREVHEGELVNLRVQHPDFKEAATASQRIPRQADARLIKADSTYRPAYTYTDRMMALELEMPPYNGEETDLLCFTAMAYVTQTEHTRISYYYDADGFPHTYRDSAGNEIYRDTVMELHNCVPYIYSSGVGFARYNNINEQLSHDFWGSDEVGLYHNANHYGTEVTFPIKTPYVPFKIEYYDAERKQYSTYRTDSVVLSVRTITRDTYLQMASMVAGNYQSVSVPDYFGSDSGDDYFDIGDLIEEIQDIFSELGNLEGIQVFGNVNNAFGHVTAEACQRIVIVP